MKGSYYFPHDYNARGNEDIVRMIRCLGWESYGLYWAIVEKLHEADGYLKLDTESLSYDLKTKADLIEKIIKNFQLFSIKGEKFTSMRVKKNIANRKMKSEKSSLSARKRWGYKKQENDANAMPSQCEGNAIKEIKGKEIKESKALEAPLDFKHLTGEEFQKYWNAYLSMRKENKKTATGEAKIIALNKLLKHPVNVAVEMLKNSIEGNWTAVYPIKPNKYQIPAAVRIKKDPDPNCFMCSGTGKMGGGSDCGCGVTNRETSNV